MSPMSPTQLLKRSSGGGRGRRDAPGCVLWSVSRTMCPTSFRPARLSIQYMKAMEASTTIVQLWTDALSRQPPAWMRRALCANERYAALHGYEYMRSTGLPSVSGRNWSAAWERVPLLIDMLKSNEGRKKPWNGTIAWFDADLQVLDTENDIGQLLSQCGPRAALVALTDVSTVAYMAGKGGRWCCRGSCVCWLNTGFLALRGVPDMDEPGSWAIALLRRMMASPQCQPYYSARQWDQDCLQSMLLEAGEMPTEEDIRRVLTLERNGTHGRATDFRKPRAAVSRSGRVCLLPHALVAPPLPAPRAKTATSSALLSHDRGSQKQLNKLIANALRWPPPTSGLTRMKLPIPFGLHATQTGCSRRSAECSKASLMAPLLRAEATIYGHEGKGTISACAQAAWTPSVTSCRDGSNSFETRTRDGSCATLAE